MHVTSSIWRYAARKSKQGRHALENYLPQLASYSPAAGLGLVAYDSRVFVA